MLESAGVVILKKPEWSCPRVNIILKRGEKSIGMNFEDFVIALKTETKVRITKNSLCKAIDIAVAKVLAEMRESVVLPMEK